MIKLKAATTETPTETYANNFSVVDCGSLNNGQECFFYQNRSHAIFDSGNEYGHCRSQGFEKKVLNCNWSVK